MTTLIVFLAILSLTLAFYLRRIAIAIEAIAGFLILSVKEENEQEEKESADEI